MRLALSLAERCIVLRQHRLLLAFLSGRWLIVDVVRGLLQAQTLEEVILLFLQSTQLLLGSWRLIDLLHLVGLSLLLDALQPLTHVFVLEVRASLGISVLLARIVVVVDTLVVDQVVTSLSVIWSDILVCRLLIMVVFLVIVIVFVRIAPVHHLIVLNKFII